MGESEISLFDEAARRTALAAGPRHHGCGLKARPVQAASVLRSRASKMEGHFMTAFFAPGRVLAITAFVCAIAQPASAQTYPSQNINVIVAFAAGGIADGIGRLVAQQVGERLKQKVVVENRG